MASTAVAVTQQFYAVVKNKLEPHRTPQMGLEKVSIEWKGLRHK